MQTKTVSCKLPMREDTAGMSNCSQKAFRMEVPFLKNSIKKFLLSIFNLAYLRNLIFSLFKKLQLWLTTPRGATPGN